MAASLNIIRNDFIVVIVVFSHMLTFYQKKNKMTILDEHNSTMPSMTQVMPCLKMNPYESISTQGFYLFFFKAIIAWQTAINLFIKTVSTISVKCIKLIFQNVKEVNNFVFTLTWWFVLHNFWFYDKNQSLLCQATPLISHIRNFPYRRFIDFFLFIVLNIHSK